MLHKTRVANSVHGVLNKRYYRTIVLVLSWWMHYAITRRCNYQRTNDQETIWIIKHGSEYQRYGLLPLTEFSFCYMKIFVLVPSKFPNTINMLLVNNCILKLGYIREVLVQHNCTILLEHDANLYLHKWSTLGIFLGYVRYLRTIIQCI